MESFVTPIWCLLIAIIFKAGCYSCRPFTDDYYKAAVFEYAREGDEFVDNAPEVIRTNLKNYERATKEAANQGSDIIVFPEYGIFPPLSRMQQKPYLESIPNPKEIGVIPCNEVGLFANRPILYTLSCMAKNNKIVIVANMGGIEPCDDDSECPADGNLQLNANVAFDPNGTLIARYYKERLFYEVGMDLPIEEQDPVFRTAFGTFATFICFDIIFEKFSKTSQRKDIDGIMFSKMWNNQSPFYTSTQMIQAWAIGNNATILSANIQKPGYFATGSGIFMGSKGSLGHTLNPDGISKLVVATVPRNNRYASSTFNITAFYENGTQKWNGDGRDIPNVCDYSVLGPTTDPQKDYRCTHEDLSNYTLAKLLKTEDHLRVCSNHMCCYLDYNVHDMNESYYFGVYNGTHSPFTRYFWWEENCFLARCDDVNGTACSTFPMKSETLFHKVHISANFTSRRIYPSVVAEKLKLLPTKDWTFESTSEWAFIKIESSSGIPLLSATLKGRPYEKDPPHVR